MQLIIVLGLVFLVGYLFGSIPVGLLVVKQISGVDIRTVGSGRTGGTNAMRAAGRKAFFIVGAGDILKGFLPVLLARLAFPDIPLAAAVAGIGAMVGVIWSVFIKFKGGAGGASNIGIVLALQPLAAVIAISMGAVAFLASGMASIGTMTGCATAMVVLFVFAWLGWVPWAYTVYGVVQLILVLIALRPNIQRIMHGTERRVSFFRSGHQT